MRSSIIQYGTTVINGCGFSIANIVISNRYNVFNNANFKLGFNMLTSGSTICIHDISITPYKKEFDVGVIGDNDIYHRSYGLSIIESGWNAPINIGGSGSYRHANPNSEFYWNTPNLGVPYALGFVYKAAGAINVKQYISPSTSINIGQLPASGSWTTGYVTVSSNYYDYDGSLFDMNVLFQFDNGIDIDKFILINGVDSDKDGALDAIEDVNHNFNYDVGDLSDWNNPDTDGDGMPDGWEITYGLSPTSSADKLGDADSDGLNNYNEYLLGTNPTLADTDNDGATDYQESYTWSGSYYWPSTGWISWSYKPDPCNPDSDGDGLNDGTELSMGTNPRCIDTDYDGYTDGYDYKQYKGELTNGLNPRNGDSDGDGLFDGWGEVGTNFQYDDGIDIKGEKYYGTAPQKTDMDYDGLTDGEEIQIFASILNGDMDNDGRLNGPFDSDTDGDGLLDGWVDLNANTNYNIGEPKGELGDPGQSYNGGFGTNPSLQDSDIDGLFDGWVDSNNNGIWDRGESYGELGDQSKSYNGGNKGGYGTDPTIYDMDNDGIKDGNDFTALPEWSPVSELIMTWPSDSATIKGDGDYQMDTGVAGCGTLTYSQQINIENIIVTIIKNLPDNIVITLNHKGSGELTKAQNMLTSAGVQLNKVQFFDVSTKSGGPWVRDYGPGFVLLPNNKIGVVDWKYEYNGDADDYPFNYAIRNGFTYIDPGDIEYSGGDFQVDGASNNHGYGINPPDEIKKIYGLGPLDAIRKVDPLNSDKLGHIDYSVYITGSYSVIVSQFNVDDPNYQKAEDTAAKFISWGFTVRRVMTPYTNDPITHRFIALYSYTNALVINNQVFVPSYNKPEDSAAKSVFEQAFPGKQVILIDSSDAVMALGVIHCLTKTRPTTP